MGASSFRTRYKEADASTAFRAAVEEARYMYGHSGYSGSIAEKSEFHQIDVPVGVDPPEFVQWVMNGEWRIDNVPEEHREQVLRLSKSIMDDKYGPAGCVKITEGEYVFFGMASS